jgi:DnaJ-class molecular chaperone
MAEDYYKTLGISRNASQADIQKAYRDLARKYHPDMNPDDKSAKQKFHQVQKAFDVLSDSEKRELYDRYGSSFEQMGGGGPGAGPGAGPGGFGGFSGFGGGGPGAGGPGAGGPGGGFHFEDVDLGDFFRGRAGQAGAGAAPGTGGFGDFFSQFTGGGTRTGRTGRSAPRRGADLSHELQIPFTTAVSGGQVEIAVQRGSGRSPAAGSGQTERINVKIPPGVEDGKKIRVRGQGEPGTRGGPPGDILITVRVAPHSHFQRRGKNLLVRVPVTLAEAAAGGKVDVPTPGGTVTLTIPPGTSSGTKLRIKGQGVPQRNGPTGDLLAEVQIVLPERLTDADRQALQAMADRYTKDPRADLRW